MRNQYLIPANSKKGKLIFNVFRPFDIILFLVGVAITLILLVVVPLDNSIILMALVLLPAGISTVLVLPIPNYHNVLVFLSDAIAFYQNPRVYIWKGWCIRDGKYKANPTYNRGMATDQRNKK